MYVHTCRPVCFSWVYRNVDMYIPTVMSKMCRIYRHMSHMSTKMWKTLQHTATHCNTLQHTATHCNALQRTHCNTLQHTATCVVWFSVIVGIHDTFSHHTFYQTYSTYTRNMKTRQNLERYRGVWCCAGMVFDMKGVWCCAGMVFATILVGLERNNSLRDLPQNPVSA